MDKKQLILIMAICGAVAAVGVMLPWGTFSAPLAVGPSSFTGFSTGWGTPVFILALLGGAAALLIHLGKVGQFVKLTEVQHVYVAAGAFALASLFTLFAFFSDAYKTASVLGETYGWHRGLGLWITLLGALAGEAAAVMLMKKTGTLPVAPPSPPKA